MKFLQQWMAAGNDGIVFPANVPGNVQSDYAKAQGWGDIQYADTVYRFEQIEDWSWTYKTLLDFAAKPNEQVYFVAEGIDYKFDILLNGEVVHSQEGMYTPVKLNVTGYLNDLMQIADEEVTAILNVNGQTQELLTWRTGVVEENQNKQGPTVNVQLPKEATEQVLILTLTTASGKQNSYRLLFTGKVDEQPKSLVMNM